MGRILRLKHSLAELACSGQGAQYVNLDDILVDLKLTPDVLELPVPKYFTKEREAEIKDRDALMCARPPAPAALCWPRSTARRPRARQPRAPRPASAR